MSSAVVRFDRVSKKFKRGERHDSLRDLVPAVVRGWFARRPDPAALEGGEFWALKDVSFEVEPGQALGIIGPNGAGKSTTLKLLTRILRPTLGQCSVRGRIGALIEIAAGFHPDLTGRENVYLQGALMGMKNPEIRKRFDQIVDFAGVESFIDTPVKRYSSGMNARLGFSIAAHLDPTVLIIDEVLSVGDAAFQQKCVERMQTYKREGVAIVFVSHNLQAISHLCDAALYLESRTVLLGPTSDVLRRYITACNERVGKVSEGRAEIVDPVLSDEHGHPVTVVQPGARLKLEATYVIDEPVTDVHVGFIVYRSTDNLVVYGGNFDLSELGLATLERGRLRLGFEFVAHLSRGHYHLECHAFHNATMTHLARLCPAGLLSVTENRTYAGVADLEVTPHVVGEPSASRPASLRLTTAVVG